ncbi:hypothetical protein Sgly_1355 [Syntrophobotulus glycolicus DSM 8271]|uniref:Uncharacterized protein n=1 Tax=Syntrophobotulus glycolicus (strain DSM 8271 / FlGlyR) TaxID=645991 RepID=F0SVV4_SYNGF|nr:hypothetical protein [Syntrophobotulus glycolicus]ADY55660.1 hypothetical protein Sgly_1355 [Syntrophobotulus glycolicus DSM 8271]
MTGKRDSLYVPIVVRALAVGALEAERRFCAQTLDYAKLAANPTGSLVPADILSTQRSMEKGVHLHWLLPNTLSHGVKEAGTDEMTFPRIPNRWQVFRLWLGQDGAVRLRHFTVESDALQSRSTKANGNAGSPSIPWDGPDKQKYRYLGRSYSAEETPPAAAEYLDKLTAVEAGNPYLTALYQDCRNVLGFYDDLTDETGAVLPAAGLTYVVCGSYSREDPLTRVESRDILTAEWGWSAPADFAPGSGMLCYGMVDRVPWKGPDTCYPHAVPENMPRIAIGNNTAEALSALLATLTPKKSQAERMMQHLLTRNHELIHEPNGILKSENALMKGRFGEWSAVEAIRLKPASREAVPPPEAEELAARINQTLEQMNDAYGQLATLRQLVYDEWYRYTQAAYAPRVTPRTLDIMDRCRERIDELAPLLERQKERYQTAAAEKKQALERLSVLVGKEFTVLEQNGQRFWEANTPLLLFSGIGMDTARDEDDARFGDGLLLCRCAGDLAAVLAPSAGEESLTLTAGEGPLIPVRGEDVLSLPQYLEEGLRPVLWEAVLLSQALAPAVEKRLREKNPQADPNRLVEAAERARRELQSGACRCHTAPWNPLYMAWQAVFYPDRAVEQAAPSLQNWRVENNDFVYEGEEIGNEDGQVFRGVDLLTPHASRLTQAAAEDALGSRPVKIEAVSQLLSGLHDQFLMIRPGLVLPVRDEVKDPELAGRVRRLLEENSPVRGHMLPAFDGYYAPLRAGCLVFPLIHIIDSFGQVKVLDTPNLIVSEYLRRGLAPVQKEVLLPPRILQPARLRLEWDQEPDRPYLCGWLLPNLIEGTLAVYDSGGEMLGSLVRIDLEGAGVIWRQPPREGGRRDDPPAGIHPDLSRFLLEILTAWRENGLDLLTPLLNVIDNAMWTINPLDAGQFGGLGAFLHRPLALVRAALCFELAEAQRAPKYPEEAPREIPSLARGRFPVRIGQRENHNDGVVGFFAQEDYTRLHLSAGYNTALPPYFSAQNSVALPVAYPAEWSHLTLLMDPVGEASLVSGLLPVKTKKVGRELVDEALRRMQYSFFLAPALTALDAPALPHPSVEDADWSFTGFSPASGLLEELTKLGLTTGEAVFPRPRLWAREGWLNLRKAVRNEQ